MNKEEKKALKNEFRIHFKNSPDELGFLEAFIDDLLKAQREKYEKELKIANCANCSEMRDLKNDRNALCYEHNQASEIVSEDELTDMFGEGGKEEVKDGF